MKNACGYVAHSTHKPTGRGAKRGLHILAVEHAAGSDPVALNAAERKDLDILDGLTLFGDL